MNKLDYIKRIIVNSCWKIIQRLPEKVTFDSNEVPDLTPTSNATKCEEYIDRLNELLINRSETVHEIAITAPYSGGKSSFIKTYCNQNRQFNYTHISLAAFKDKTAKKAKENVAQKNKVSAEQEEDLKLETISEVDQNINKIEKSIVQQILYTTDSEQLAGSRFRRIMKVPLSPLSLMSLSFAFTLLGLCIWAVLELPEFSIIKILQIISNEKLTAFILLTPYIYSISLIIVVLKDLLKTVSTLSLTKLNPIKGELAFEQKSNDSIFNIYLEEIIYYFARTKVNVVFFEDLDRFERTDIFVKLKELNKLINDSKDVIQDIRFIYALKDDVFKGNTRTKFFDAIIPIIPVVNKSNVFPLLKEILNGSGLKGELCDTFLRDISVFVDDMRMLKNIVSEYLIYKKALSNSLEGIENQKLFSFIIYKNIYCDDFALLHSGEGDLASFFKNIGIKKKSCVNEIEEKISILNKKLIAADNEYLQSIEELNAAYLLVAISNHNQADTIKIANHPITSIYKDDLFSRLYSSKASLETIRAPNYRGQQIIFPDLINELKPAYSTRKKQITNRDRQKRRLISLNIAELKEEQRTLRYLSVSKLAKKYAMYDELKDKELLIHMIEKGYIDEQYHLYISHFHEGNMNKVDMDFVFAVKRKEKFDQNIELQNHEEILKHFTLDEFNSLSFMNFSMINYLLEKQNKEILSVLIKEVIAINAKSAFILKDSISSVKNLSRWVSLLLETWPNIWDYIVSVKEVSQEDKNSLIIELLSHVDDSSDMSASNEFNIYIQQHDELSGPLSLSANQDNVINIFEKLNIRFETLQNSIHQVSFLSSVIEKDLIKINAENLLVVLNHFSEQSKYANFNLSIAYQLNLLELECFIDDNIEDVAQLLIHKEIELGDEEAYVRLLNTDELSEESKISIIKSEKMLIENIESIDQRELWDIIFSNVKVRPNWNNIDSCFEYKRDEYNNFLSEFINHEIVYTSLKESPDKLSKSGYINFTDFLVNVDKVSLEAFKALQNKVGAKLSEVNNYKLLSSEKVNSLILGGYIEANDENYANLEEYFDVSTATLLIECDFTAFHNNVDINELNLTADQVDALITSEKLAREHKLLLISEFAEGFIDSSREVKKIVANLISSTEHPPTISNDLQKELLSLNLTIEMKVIIYLSQIDNLSDEDKKQYLCLLGNDYKNIVLAKSHSYIPLTQYNEKLLSILKDRKVISTYSEESPLLGDKRIRVNVKRG